MRQTKRESILETAIQTVADFVISLVVTILVVIPGLYAYNHPEVAFWDAFWGYFIVGDANHGGILDPLFWLLDGLTATIITAVFSVLVFLRTYFVRRWFVGHRDS